MARRKRAKKVTHRRKRRSGIHGFSAASAMNQVQPLIFGIVGGIAAQAVTYHLLKDSTMDDKIKAAIPIAVGIGMKMFDKSNGMISQIGSGMALTGGVNISKQFFPGITGITDGDMAGIEEDIVIEGNEMLTINGDESDASIGEMLTISGMGDQID